jgi:hypothetical protein
LKGNAVRDIRTAGAFCWVQKTVLRRIREAFDSSGDAASAQCVYLALAEIASDFQKDEFQATHGYIVQKSGLGRRTVQYRLKELSEIGLISISTPKLKTACTYRLIQLPTPKEKVKKPDAHSVRNAAHLMRNDAPHRMRTLEESKEERTIPNIQSWRSDL